uniref:Histone H1 n=1 Tax=Xiphophorus couchianus TaxID=32473 RepID=A0A3B5LZ12_9TELE
MIGSDEEKGRKTQRLSSCSAVNRCSFQAPVTKSRKPQRFPEMAEVAPAPPPVAAPAKAAKKKASKPKKSGPSVGELIVKTVAASKERGGVSAAALKKALAAGGYDVDKNKARVRTAIKSLLTKGTLVHTKGTGASGSFKMARLRCRAEEIASSVERFRL